MRRKLPDFWAEKNTQNPATSLAVMVFSVPTVCPNIDLVLTNPDLCWPLSPCKPDQSSSISPGGPDLFHLLLRLTSPRAKLQRQTLLTRAEVWAKNWTKSSGDFRASPFKRSRAAKRGGFKRGCFPIWTFLSFFVLFCPFLSFFVLSRFFWDFPDLVGDGPGIFPIGPFPLFRPVESTNEEQSRKGPRHNLDLSRKKRETPRFGNTPV